MNTTNPMKISQDAAHHEYSDKFLRTLSTYTDNEIKVIMKDYLKVMFVRDPLERLLSAFNDKFANKKNSYFPKVFGKKIKSLLYQQKYKSILKQKYKPILNVTNITFAEFIKYLTLSPVQQDNEHWQQYSLLCHPCHIHYHIIGKYETFNQDVDYVLKILGVDDFVTFPTKHGLKTSDIMNSAYRTVPSEDILKLVEK
jgi:chondroitin 4-sulfotransferase 11